MNRAWLIPPITYLLGSIPFGYILYRVRFGGDIRQTGSGNIGATNVMRSAGPLLGTLTLLLDASKGFVAIVIADALSYRVLDQPYVFMRSGADLPSVRFYWLSIALLCVLLGHLYTPWLRFRGGKGIATGLGAFLALAPKALLVAAVIFVALVAIWRFVSLASIIVSALMPFLVWHFYRGGYPFSILAATTAVACLIIWRHKGNLERLLAGTEPHLGERTRNNP